MALGPETEKRMAINFVEKWGVGGTVENERIFLVFLDGKKLIRHEPRRIMYFLVYMHVYKL